MSNTSVRHSGSLSCEDGIKPIKYALIDLAAGATAEIVAGVVGKKIRVLTLVVTGATANGTLVLKSATTALTGALNFAANGGFAIHSDQGLFETAAGAALNGTTVTTTIDGFLAYVETI